MVRGLNILKKKRLFKGKVSFPFLNSEQKQALQVKRERLVLHLSFSEQVVSVQKKSWFIA